MINIKNITRTYGDFIAVDDVSFSIKEGEIVGLLGHNGAGKTTVMKMLSGHLEATLGEIQVDGISINDNQKAVQSKIGYLPESLPLYPEMTVIDYLHYVANIRSLKSDEANQSIAYAIEATNLTEKLSATISTLSRGYKQRVAVAQATLGSPKVLILDEPTNGLDPTQTQHMRNLIKDLSKRTTIILSTHIMQEVDAICNRALIMSNGKLVLDSRLEDLQQSKYLELHTTMPENKVKNLVSEEKSLLSIKLVSREEESALYIYRLTLADKSIGNKVSAVVAKRVIDGGFKLHQINVQKQDLETVFRQTNSINEQSTKEENQHVA